MAKKDVMKQFNISTKNGKKKIEMSQEVIDLMNKSGVQDVRRFMIDQFNKKD